MSGHPRIEKVETFLVDLPTIRPHELSMTTVRRQTLLIVRIHTSDGVVGLGEGTTIGGLTYGAENLEGMKLAIDTNIAPVLERSDPDRVGQTMAKVGKAVRDNHFAKCAIETALLDAFAKRRGLPLGDLLGGRFHERLPIAWVLASGDTARDIAEAEEMLDRRRHKISSSRSGAASRSRTSRTSPHQTGRWRSRQRARRREPDLERGDGRLGDRRAGGRRHASSIHDDDP